MTKLKSYLHTQVGSSSSYREPDESRDASATVSVNVRQRKTTDTSPKVAPHCKISAPSATSGGDETALEMKQTLAKSDSKQPTGRQFRGSRESKWWRSCWNGNQMDGDLLYKTIKAQQERRLADRMLTFNAPAAGSGSSSGVGSASAEHLTTPPQDDTSSATALVDGSRQSYVYATPKPRQPAEARNRCNHQTSSFAQTGVWQSAGSLRQPLTSSLGHSGSSSSSSSSSSTSSRSPIENKQAELCRLKVTSDCQEEEEEEEDEEDPLSDPLYASILGTSKQLRAISAGSANLARWSPGRRAERLQMQAKTDRSSSENRQQREFCSTTQMRETTGCITVNNSHHNSECFISAGRQQNMKVCDVNLSGDASVLLEQQHVYDNLPGNGANTSDPAWQQLKSLVEKCLEVQRATQNSSLLPIEDDLANKNNEQDQDEYHPANHEQDDRHKTSSFGNDQM